MLPKLNLTRIVCVGFVICVFFMAQNVMAQETVAVKTPAPAKKPLYERLGGETGIAAVVDDFVNRAAADPKVNFTRQGTAKLWDANAENVARLKKHLTEFISVATGNPNGIYEGKDMKTTHEGMKITTAEFDALAEDLQASLQKLNVPEQEQKELLDIVGTTRGVIVEEVQ